MFLYNLINKPKFSINKKTIDNIFKKVSKIVSIEQKGQLNIVFVKPFSIQKLNNDHRKIDKVTDVLSFHYHNDFSKLNIDDIAGEIVICEEKLKTQAVDYGLGEEKEFYKLLIHSILHILGYDHEIDKEYIIMQNLENEIWQKVFEK